MATSKFIGIDLGTSYSSVAVYKNGKVEVIKFDDGETSIPSVVAFTDTSILIGKEAKLQTAENAENTVFNVKRLIGRRFNDSDFPGETHYFPLRLKEKDAKIAIEVGFQKRKVLFYPEEITALILQKLKTTAEQYLGYDVEGAVVSVPASFNNSQRTATRDAAIIAGFREVRLLNEPTATAITYASESSSTSWKVILVVDCGGGTIDASIIYIEDAKVEVRSTAGDTQLGGIDFDRKLWDHVLRDIENHSSIEPRTRETNRWLPQRRVVWETTKEKLSISDKEALKFGTRSQDTEVISRIERTQFEESCEDLFQKIMKFIENVFSNSGIGKQVIADVILVGGTTIIPKIGNLVEKSFDGKKFSNFDWRDEAVVRGAAILAAKIDQQQEDFIQKFDACDVIPMKITLEEPKRFQAIFEKYSKIPASQKITVNESEISIVVHEVIDPETERELGKYKIVGTSQKPIPKWIDLVFDIDGNGILDINAYPTATKNSSPIGIVILSQMLSVTEVLQLAMKMRKLYVLSSSEAENTSGIESDKKPETGDPPSSNGENCLLPSEDEYRKVSSDDQEPGDKESVVQLTLDLQKLTLSAENPETVEACPDEALSGINLETDNFDGKVQTRPADYSTDPDDNITNLQVPGPDEIEGLQGHNDHTSEEKSRPHQLESCRSNGKPNISQKDQLQQAITKITIEPPNEQLSSSSSEILDNEATLVPNKETRPPHNAAKILGDTEGSFSSSETDETTTHERKQHNQKESSCLNDGMSAKQPLDAEPENSMTVGSKLENGESGKTEKKSETNNVDYHNQDRPENENTPHDGCTVESSNTITPENIGTKADPSTEMDKNKQDEAVKTSEKLDVPNEHESKNGMIPACVEYGKPDRTAVVDKPDGADCNEPRETLRDLQKETSERNDMTDQRHIENDVKDRNRAGAIEPEEHCLKRAPELEQLPMNANLPSNAAEEDGNIGNASTEHETLTEMKDEVSVRIKAGTKVRENRSSENLDESSPTNQKQLEEKSATNCESSENYDSTEGPSTSRRTNGDCCKRILKKADSCETTGNHTNGNRESTIRADNPLVKKKMYQEEKPNDKNEVHTSPDNIPIGISLGTKYCCVGVYKNEKFEVIPNESGNRTTPSVVSFHRDDKELFVGDSAATQGIRNTENTIYNAKRFIGRHPEDGSVQSDKKLVSFGVIERNSKICFDTRAIGRENMTPEEITAIILRNQKNLAEKHLNSVLTDVVITVPGSFNDYQRDATVDAARVAGFRSVQLMNEPIAAALAYGIENNVIHRRTVLIFNLGGGSFDLSIVEISKKSEVKVVFSTGNPSFGGEDFVQRLISHFASEYETLHRENLMENSRALRKLRIACERATKTLTHSTEASIGIEALYDDTDFYTTITRSQFEEICSDLFQNVKAFVENALNSEEVSVGIEDVVIIGGGSRIPKIVQILESIFGEKKLKFSINREEAAVYGAAVRAARLNSVVITGLTSSLSGGSNSGEANAISALNLSKLSSSRIEEMSTRINKIFEDNKIHHELGEMKNRVELYVITVRSFIHKRENRFMKKSDIEALLQKCEKAMQDMDLDKNQNAAKISDIYNCLETSCERIRSKYA